MDATSQRTILSGIFGLCISELEFNCKLKSFEVYFQDWYDEQCEASRIQLANLIAFSEFSDPPPARFVKMYSKSLKRSAILRTRMNLKKRPERHARISSKSLPARSRARGEGSSPNKFHSCQFRDDCRA